MGFWSKIAGGSKVKSECKKDPETGDIHCKSARVNSDGTESTIAEYSATEDANCNIVMSHSVETEEGALNDLTNKTLPRVVAKCKGNNRSNPSDF